MDDKKNLTAMRESWFAHNGRSLRKRINESQEWYMERYGKLDWRWTDEGLPYAILDYHCSMGSVAEFMEDDWRVCKENDMSLAEVIELCEDSEFLPWVETAEEFYDECLCNGRDIGYYEAREEFYMWKNRLLPKAESVYSED